jgi:hypothetical protein
MITANVSDEQPPVPCVECTDPTPAKVVIGFTGSEVRNALCGKHVTMLKDLLAQKWIDELSA